MNKPQVIAISGASGCGKTTLIKQLATELNCSSLFFDDYVDEDTYPQDMKKWLADGANASLIKTPRFTDALKQLKRTVKSPYIFIEEPFGKEREVMSTLIDKVILLDLPLEICLARLVKRNISLNAEKSLKLIPTYLAKYEDYFRDIYLESVAQVRRNSDLVIEDVDSIGVISNYIREWLHRH
ncbi:MAG: uridine kinase [Alteromonadaceae bacterium]|jgi:uridine kinase